jgi:hypothetical protein
MIDLILGSCVVIDSYNNLREVKIKQWMFSELPHITHPVIKWVEEEKKRKARLARFLHSKPVHMTQVDHAIFP